MTEDSQRVDLGTSIHRFRTETMYEDVAKKIKGYAITVASRLDTRDVADRKSKIIEDLKSDRITYCDFMTFIVPRWISLNTSRLAVAEMPVQITPELDREMNPALRTAIVSGRLDSDMVAQSFEMLGASVFLYRPDRASEFVRAVVRNHETIMLGMEYAGLIKKQSDTLHQAEAAFWEKEGGLYSAATSGGQQAIQKYFEERRLQLGMLSKRNPEMAKPGFAQLENLERRFPTLETLLEGYRFFRAAGRFGAALEGLLKECKSRYFDLYIGLERANRESLATPGRDVRHTGHVDNPKDERQR